MDRNVVVHNSNGRHPVVLVCEHASAFFPPRYQRLGLDHTNATGHIAWDPGAVETSRCLADKLDAVLVEGTVSRLIYDLNRPPDSPGAMAERSENTVVPGNIDLPSDEIKHRVETYYLPFKNKLATLLSSRTVDPILITIHSFTPQYNGRDRDVEVGILHDVDTLLADRLLDVADGYNIQRNAPYGPDDGVTHTLQQHGLAHGYLNVMIEIRNDLLTSKDACEAVAADLYRWITLALDGLCQPETHKQGQVL